MWEAVSGSRTAPSASSASTKRSRSPRKAASMVSVTDASRRCTIVASISGKSGTLTGRSPRGCHPRYLQYSTLREVRHVPCVGYVHRRDAPAVEHDRAQDIYELFLISRGAVEDPGVERIFVLGLPTHALVSLLAPRWGLG